MMDEISDEDDIQTSFNINSDLLVKQASSER